VGVFCFSSFFLNEILKECLGSRVKSVLLEICWICALMILEECTDLFSEHLSKFNTPLVETVDIPKETFNSSSVLVQSKKLSNSVCVELSEEKRKRRSITREKFMALQGFRYFFSFQFFKCLSTSKGIWL